MRLVDTDEVLDKDFFDFKLNSFKISAGSSGTFTGEVQLARGVDDPCDVAATTAQKASECVGSSWMASVLPESESDSAIIIVSFQSGTALSSFYIRDFAQSLNSKMPWYAMWCLVPAFDTVQIGIPQVKVIISLFYE